MEKFPVNGTERKRIGYIHEFHMNMDSKDWVADQDMNSTDPDVTKVVQGWLYGIVHSWSNTSENYQINHNHAVGHSEEEEWVAYYTSIFYDCMESVVLAYGRTPEEALINVKALTESVVKYFIDDEESEPDPIIKE